ncbi:hypothetical protein L228DRAFT_41840 [Xylona heveae TC161]|uniref:Uncharacterized protein n=1 Tax=Xylona heveae (strain CBS 132557 / TC161) TaxID=1328760 RepID=A0A164ZPH7_XYLHT|nr:hypothetical protein L228DRAFT_41840 [Xylona heveae TC161]KZF19344.1 hypothetical protein L228DRAFT_41840 [Xylona heveae TC161]
MAPFLKSQNDRIDAQHSMIKNLQRRNDILEGGLTSIQAMLCTSTFDSVGVDSTTLLASASSPLSPPPASSSATAGSASTSTLTSVPNQPNPDPADLPPFNSAIHHLLSLHESLRQEVDRVSAAVSELDARSSMMIMNESLRNKEDITHTNAALNSMRMQLHWLLSARLQMQSRMAAAAAAAANSPAGSTAATSPPNRSRDMGVGTSGAAVASAFGLPPPLRRMSGMFPLSPSSLFSFISFLFSFNFPFLCSSLLPIVFTFSP